MYIKILCLVFIFIFSACSIRGVGGNSHQGKGGDGVHIEEHTTHYPSQYQPYGGYYGY